MSYHGSATGLPVGGAYYPNPQDQLTIDQQQQQIPQPGQLQSQQLLPNRSSSLRGPVSPLVGNSNNNLRARSPSNVGVNEGMGQAPPIQPRPTSYAGESMTGGMDYMMHPDYTMGMDPAAAAAAYAQMQAQYQHMQSMQGYVAGPIPPPFPPYQMPPGVGVPPNMMPPYANYPMMPPQGPPYFPHQHQMPYPNQPQQQPIPPQGPPMFVNRSRYGPNTIPTQPSSLQAMSMSPASNSNIPSRGISLERNDEEGLPKPGSVIAPPADTGLGRQQIMEWLMRTEDGAPPVEMDSETVSPDAGIPVRTADRVGSSSVNAPGTPGIGPGTPGRFKGSRTSGGIPSREPTRKRGDAPAISITSQLFVVFDDGNTRPISSSNGGISTPQTPSSQRSVLRVYALARGSSSAERFFEKFLSLQNSSGASGGTGGDAATAAVAAASDPNNGDIHVIKINGGTVEAELLEKFLQSESSSSRIQTHGGSVDDTTMAGA
ncbi:hypothetical protein HDU76_007897, partial [Blyttiomyces sp. JEL0837]